LLVVVLKKIQAGSFKIYVALSIQWCRPEGQVHPQNLLFVENACEIPENSGKEVSTHLFTIELSDFFPPKKKFFALCKYAHI